MHGGLDRASYQSQDQHQRSHSHSVVAEQPAERKERQKRERQHHVETESRNDQVPPKQKRYSQEKGLQSPDRHKKTLRTRLSRFMHGGGLGQGQSAVVTAN